MSLPPLFPPRRDPDPEHRYTIEEAEAILTRETCDRHGHEVETNLIRNMLGTIVQHHIVCTRCHARFRETTE